MKESTVFMLLYGDYHELHKKALTPLVQQDDTRLDVRLWLNVVCLDTAKWLVENAPAHWLIYVADQNIPKYHAMARMFHDGDYPITTPWITWFDDDSIIKKGNWLNKTLAFIAENPRVVLFGRACVKRHMSGIESWIKRASWYSKREFQTLGKKLRGIHFIQGCYWWLTRNVLERLDWPDSRLSHNGGDTALSEAIWQQGFEQAGFTYGVDVDVAARRGMTERPAGSRRERARHSDNSRPACIGAMAQYMEIFADSSSNIIPVTSTTATSTRHGRTTVKHVVVPPKVQPKKQVKVDTGRQITTSYLSRPIVPQRHIRSVRPKVRPKKTLKVLLRERTRGRFTR